MRRRGAWWHNRFHNLGMRITEPREVVMAILSETKDHLTAADIYVEAHGRNPGIGLTTVYRTLEVLLQMGIVQKFDFGEGKARYELIRSGERGRHHHHLICVRCKSVIDYSEFLDEERELIEKTRKKLEKKYNFTISDHVIGFYGLCSKCRNKVPG